MKRIAIVLLALAAGTLRLGTAEAQQKRVSPLQGGHYYPSLLDLRDLTTPAPGLYLLWYNGLTESGSFYDRSGNKVDTINLSQLNPKLPNVNVNLDQKAFASVPMAMWAADSMILGGARYFATLAVPYVSVNASLVNGGSTAGTSGGQTVSGSVGGFSDISFAPVGLSWTFPTFDITAVDTLYAPTGQYTAGELDNTGLGFWTNQLQLFGYYYPRGDRNTAIQLGLTYEWNGQIKDVEVTPGQRFTVQYGIDHYFTERLLLGVSGGNNMQVTNDSGSGVYWDASVHDRQSFWGLSAGYWVWQDRLMIIAKYTQNYGSIQHFGNDTFFLNFKFNTDLLTGRK